MHDHDNVLGQVTGQITGVSDVTWQIIGVPIKTVIGRHDNILEQSCFNYVNAHDKKYKQQKHFFVQGYKNQMRMIT